MRDKHNEDNRKDGYRCNQCDYECDYKGFLKQHMRKYHNIQNPVITHNCRECDFKGQSMLSLKLHVKCMHSDPHELSYD